ncbi:hypothetical protein AI2905V1_2613 [Enterobacter cloacae]|nr:hypothetical protein AI2905V1_2613 [Enterobacter cloacae]CAH5882781.1 hypothetical protein AI2905V1_2613 [Enterobacter cloacae]CAH5905986.1 hypothetical protein AI2916V1_3408 [Enterobacter cloacae]
MMLVEFIVNSIKRNLTNKLAFCWDLNFMRNIIIPSITQCDRFFIYRNRKIQLSQSRWHSMSHYLKRI